MRKEQELAEQVRDKKKAENIRLKQRVKNLEDQLAAERAVM